MTIIINAMLILLLEKMNEKLSFIIHWILFYFPKLKIRRKNVYDKKKKNNFLRCYTFFGYETLLSI